MFCVHRGTDFTAVCLETGDYKVWKSVWISLTKKKKGKRDSGGERENRGTAKGREGWWLWERLQTLQLYLLVFHPVPQI